MTAAALSWMAIGLIVGAAVGTAACSVVLHRLRASQRDAQQADRLLQLWVDGAADYALFVLDPAGRVSQWNADAERLHGYPATEIIGQHYSCLYPSEDRDARVPQATLEISARQGRHRSGGWRMRKGGDRFCAETLMQALRDDRGRLIGFSSLERDVSERLQQQQALSQMRSALSQAQRLAALGRVSDGITHDFNNVVQVIKNCVQVLQRQLIGESQSAEFLQMIKRNAERASALSQHLLKLARRAHLNALPTNVNEVVADVAELLRQTVSENILIELNLDEGLSWVLVDRNELEAALLNIAANARDAMLAGGKLTVATANVLWHEGSAPSEANGRAGHHVLITVERAGPPAVAGSASDVELEMVRSFAEQAGGRLQTEARTKLGAAVKLYLPCRAG